MLCNSQGVCKKQVGDTIQRLWDIIENITVDRLGQFCCYATTSLPVLAAYDMNSVLAYIVLSKDCNPGLDSELRIL